MSEITQLSDCAQDGGAYVVSLTWRDEDDTNITPTTVTWTLTDRYGTVINSREDVSVTPALTNQILLSGDDLNYSDGKHRRFRATYVYTSATLGVVTQKVEYEIEIVDHVAEGS